MEEDWIHKDRRTQVKNVHSPPKLVMRNQNGYVRVRLFKDGIASVINNHVLMLFGCLCVSCGHFQLL